MQTAGCARGIVTDGRTARPLSVLNFYLIAHAYGPKGTQPKQPSIRGTSRCTKKRQQKRREEPLAGGKRLGRIHAGQNDGERKDRPVAVHHVLRSFYRHRLAGLSATLA